MTTVADEPVRPARPTTVTVAFWMQLAIAALLVVLAGLAVAATVQFDGQIDRAAGLVPDADPDEVRGERIGNVVTGLSIAVPALLLAVWFAATARPVRRGGNTARILVFVAGGLQLLLCCGQGCLGVFFVPFLLTDSAGMETEGPDGELIWEESEFFETLYGDTDLASDLLSMGAAGGLFLVLVLTAVVVLLLTVPPAHRFFVPAGDAPTGPKGAAPAPAWPYPTAPFPPFTTFPPFTNFPPGATFPPGAPLPGAYPPVYAPVPPGYLICPDPAVHLPRPESGDGATPPAAPTGPQPTSTDRGPEPTSTDPQPDPPADLAPGPSVADR